MSSNEAVESYLRGEISRRTFIRRLTAAGIGVTAAYAYAQLLTPEWAQADVRCDPFYEEHYDQCREVAHEHPPPPSPPPPPKDTAAPVTTVSASKISLATLLLTRRFVVRFKSNEAAAVALTASVGSGKKAAKVGAGSAVFTKPGTKKIPVKLTKKGRRILARRRRGPIYVDSKATDAAGNVRKRRLSVKLK